MNQPCCDGRRRFGKRCNPRIGRYRQMWSDAGRWAAEAVGNHRGFEFADTERVWIRPSDAVDPRVYACEVYPRDRFDSAPDGFVLTRAIQVRGWGGGVPDWLRRVDLGRIPEKRNSAMRVYVLLADVAKAPRKCHSSEWCRDHRIGARDECRWCALYLVLREQLFEREIKSWRTEKHRLQKLENQLIGIRAFLKTPEARRLPSAA